MPFIDLTEQALRAKALQPQQLERVPSFWDQAFGGLVSGFESGIQRGQAAESEKAKQEAELRKSALERAVSENQIAVKGPTNAEVPVGEGEFDIGGLRFGKGMGKPVAGKESLEEYLAKAEGKARIDQRYGLGKRDPIADAYEKDQIKQQAKIDQDLKALDVGQDLGRTILAQASKIKDKLGPANSLWQAAAEKVGKADPELLRQRTLLSANLADYVRQMSGTASSDKEREFINSFKENRSDTFEQLMAKVQGLDDYANSKRGSLLKIRSSGPRTSNPPAINAADYSGAIPNTQVSRQPLQPPVQMPAGAVKMQRNNKTGAVRYLDAQGNVVGG